MCLFVYFIVYWRYSKFVYEFTFLMYLVVDHMSWICYDFEHSSSRRNMGKITQFRGWFSNIFLNVASPTESFEFVLTYVFKLLLSKTYKSQASPRWNALIFSLRPSVYSQMRYLSFGCRGETTGGVVIWWKICRHKFLILLSRKSGMQERKRPGRRGIL